MLEINIPGRGTFQFKHLVCDVNGTLAVDGNLIAGVPQALQRLQDHLTLHLVTADTHGHQNTIDQQLKIKATRLQSGNELEQKAAYVRQLGADRVIAIGQGANDAMMLAEAALGICLLSEEGLAKTTILAADLIVPDILSALKLFEKPLRIAASLRQ